MRADADLSPLGIAKLKSEFLERLNLRDVTLVGNDSGLSWLLEASAQKREGFI
jgi:hypothetical protein